MTSPSIAIPRRPRAPGLVYLVISLVLLVFVAVIALTARQPPPPTIAEFAPQAQEQIKDAPTEQSSEFGTGEGLGECPPGAVCGPGEGLGGTAGSPETIETPRVRKCIGDPPRQIEDPQSPPCVPYWDGDNGGATWKGVDASTIRVARPGGSTIGDEEVAMQSFFNKRFEFYGRKIVLIPYEPPGDSANNPSNMNADAVKADEQLNVFASLAYSDRGGTEFHYYDELARRQIISASGRATMADEERFSEFQPYQWNYLPGVDLILRNLADMYCKSFHGRAPRYSDIDADKRKLGIILESAQDGSTPDVSGFTQALEACGVNDAVWSSHQRTQSDASTTILRLSTENVTTVMCLCHQGELAFNYMPRATSQAFFPEWIVSTYLYHDSDIGGQTYSREHQNRVFGISFRNKMLPPPEDPRWWAVKEADPSMNPARNPELNPFNAYKQLLLLASGIQLAGPELTPESFQRGLFRARFPNPDAGNAPYFQATAGFGPGDHTMQDDAALIWFNPEATSQEYHNSQGAWCYFQKGKRFRLGTWPNEEPLLFEGECY